MDLSFAMRLLRNVSLGCTTFVCGCSAIKIFVVFKQTRCSSGACAGATPSWLTLVWRTGGGKTAIFAIPAIFHDGLTVVVLPLISLIEDVVRKLEESLWIASGAIGGYIVDL